MVKMHVSLNVSDVERSTRFYEVFFGVAAHKRRPGYANFDLEAPALKLALNEQDPGTGGPLNHLGFLVPSTDDVHAARRRLEQAGLIIFSEENVECCYALQDKIWVRDPDGNAWEVYTLLDELEDEGHEDRHGRVSLPVFTECCGESAKSDCCSE